MRSIAKAAILYVMIMTVVSCGYSEDAAVLEVAHSYAEAWDSGDEDLMASILHDRLAKRAILPVPNDGKYPKESENVWRKNSVYLHDQGKVRLVEKTKNNDGQSILYSKKKVELLDRKHNAAAVKISVGWMEEYLHLVKVEDSWQVINVLWALRQ